MCNEVNYDLSIVHRMSLEMEKKWEQELRTIWSLRLAEIYAIIFDAFPFNFEDFQCHENQCTKQQQIVLVGLPP